MPQSHRPVGRTTVGQNKRLGGYFAPTALAGVTTLYADTTAIH